MIFKKNGLISFIIHPDYMIEKRARDLYAELLQLLVDLREKQRLWIALPGEVNQWWRNRSQMKLVQTGTTWKIQGTGSERARIAYATLIEDRIVYTVENKS